MNIQTAKKEKIRDPRWLRLEVCRDYTRDNKCDRGLEQCRFAHPGKNCVTTNGKVTACYDSMKGRCSRESCKFYHPPDHIKKNIQALGKAFEQQRLLEEQSVDHIAGLHAPLQLPSFNLLPVVQSIPGLGHLPRRVDNSDRLPICGYFVSKACRKITADCQFAHPPASVQVDPDGFVTVCMDFIAGHCDRDSCKYFHPPSHLKARVQAVQLRHTPPTTQFPVDDNRIPLQPLTTGSIGPVVHADGFLPLPQPLPPVFYSQTAPPLLLYNMPPSLGLLTDPVCDPMVLNEPNTTYLPVPFVPR